MIYQIYYNGVELSEHEYNIKIEDGLLYIQLYDNMIAFVGMSSRKGKIRIGQKNIYSIKNKYSKQNLTNHLETSEKPFVFLDEKYISAKTESNFLCKICGSVHKNTADQIKFMNNCPYCCPSPKLVNSTNSIRTKRPDLIKFLKDESDSDKYTPCSNKKIEIQCPECYKERVMIVNDLEKQGFRCSVCGDKISTPDKFCRALLDNTGIDFEIEKSFDWSGRMLYDSYIPSINTIIENMGKHHYEETAITKVGRCLEDEKANDYYKEDLANKNGIKKYIKIDCSIVTFYELKKSFSKSLDGVIDIKNVDWMKVWENTQKSLLVESCKMWNIGYSVVEICDVIKYRKSTIVRWLKKGTQIKMADYSTEESYRRTWRSKVDT